MVSTLSIMHTTTPQYLKPRTFNVPDNHSSRAFSFLLFCYVSKPSQVVTAYESAHGLEITQSLKSDLQRADQAG